MIDVDVRLTLGAFRLDAAFEAPAGRITVLFGPSGAGKSTMLALIAGLLRPDDGHVAVDGRALTDIAARVFLPPERRSVGWVHQDARLFPHLNVAANLDYGARRSRRPAAFGRDDVIATLGIAPLLPRRPRDLSGGERGRVALARALLANPEVLLLDEPLAALDGRLRAEILPLIAALRDQFGTTMVYVTHDRAEALALGDRIVMLDHGRVVAIGTSAELLGQPTHTGVVLADGTVSVPGFSARAGARVSVTLAPDDD